MEVETDTTMLNLENSDNSEVEEIKLVEQDNTKNVSITSKILDSLKNKWYYFHYKFMNLVACTINTGENINNVKEPLVLEEEPEEPSVSLAEPEPTPEVVVEQPVAEPEPTPEVVAEESLPIATPVVVEQSITLDERI